MLCKRQHEFSKLTSDSDEEWNIILYWNEFNFDCLCFKLSIFPDFTEKIIQDFVEAGNKEFIMVSLILPRLKFWLRNSFYIKFTISHKSEPQLKMLDLG